VRLESETPKCVICGKKVDFEQSAFFCPECMKNIIRAERRRIEKDLRKNQPHNGEPK